MISKWKNKVITLRVLIETKDRQKSRNIDLYQYLYRYFDHIPPSCTQMQPKLSLHHCLKLMGVRSAQTNPVLTLSHPTKNTAQLMFFSASSQPSFSQNEQSWVCNNGTITLKAWLKYAEASCERSFNTLGILWGLSPFNSRGKSSLTVNEAGVFLLHLLWMMQPRMACVWSFNIQMRKTRMCHHKSLYRI